MVETNLPVILLKNNILFPYSEIRVEFVNTGDKLVLESSLKDHDNHLLMVNLDDPLEENPNISTLILPYILRMISAGILTYFSIGWFKDIMQKGKLKYFVYYCLIMGIITMLFI